MFGSFFSSRGDPGPPAGKVASKKEQPSSSQEASASAGQPVRTVKLAGGPEPGKGRGRGQARTQDRSASPAKSQVSTASADATLGIGLSAYFSGHRESMSQLLVRLRAAVGTLATSTEGILLEGFPTRGELKRLLKAVIASENRDALPEEDRRVLETAEVYFRRQEQIYDSTGDRREEKEANLKFSQAYQIAGQVARKFVSYEPDMKELVRIKYQGGDSAPWYFTCPSKQLKAPTVTDNERVAIISKLKSSGMIAELKKASNLPSTLVSDLNTPDRPTVDREFILV